MFELTEGIHTLRVWTRENEARLDSVYMSTDDNAQPVLASGFDGRDRTGTPKAVRFAGHMAITWAGIRQWR